MIIPKALESAHQCSIKVIIILTLSWTDHVEVTSNYPRSTAKVLDLSEFLKKSHFLWILDNKPLWTTAQAHPLFWAWQRVNVDGFYDNQMLAHHVSMLLRYPNECPGLSSIKQIWNSRTKQEMTSLSVITASLVSWIHTSIGLHASTTLRIVSWRPWSWRPRAFHIRNFFYPLVQQQKTKHKEQH